MLGIAVAPLQALPPGNYFDLSHWKLTLPIDAAGGTTGVAMEIKTAELQTYTSQFLYTGTDGAMSFWCPVIGALTTSATAPRTELRELLDGRNTDVNWAATGTHILRGQCRVTQLPDTGAVIIGQVHGYPSQVLVKIQYDGAWVRASVHTSLTGGGDIPFYYYVGPDALVDYEIKIVDGVASVTVNGVTYSHDFFADDLAWRTTTYYFKAGAYLQDKSGPLTEGGRVSFYQLSVSHPTAGTPPAITTQPVSQTVARGGGVTLAIAASGTAPLVYQWRTNAVNWPGRTNATLPLNNFQAADERRYDVVVSNGAGAVTSTVARLYLNAPLRFISSASAGGRFSALLAGATGSNYVVQCTTNLVNWIPVATNSSTSGLINFTDTTTPGGKRYYRAR